MSRGGRGCRSARRGDSTIASLQFHDKPGRLPSDKGIYTRNEHDGHTAAPRPMRRAPDNRRGGTAARRAGEQPQATAAGSPRCLT